MPILLTKVDVVVFVLVVSVVVVVLVLFVVEYAIGMVDLIELDSTYYSCWSLLSLLLTRMMLVDSVVDFVLVSMNPYHPSDVDDHFEIYSLSSYCSIAVNSYLDQLMDYSNRMLLMLVMSL